jgi:hypothetical protein
MSSKSFFNSFFVESKVEATTGIRAAKVSFVLAIERISSFRDVGSTGEFALAKVDLALAMLGPGVTSLLGRRWISVPLENTLTDYSVPGLDRVPFFGAALFTNQSFLA